MKTKTITKRMKNEILDLWFYSELKNSRSNLAIQNTENLFTIGIFSYNSTSGEGYIDPIYGNLDYEEVKNLLESEL
jgi:hypothetical protein